MKPACSKAWNGSRGQDVRLSESKRAKNDLHLATVGEREVRHPRLKGAVEQIHRAFYAAVSRHQPALLPDVQSIADGPAFSCAGSEQAVSLKGREACHG